MSSGREPKVADSPNASAPTIANRTYSGADVDSLYDFGYICKF